MTEKPQKNKHPMQPIAKDEQGVVRFKHNQIVRYLLDYASRRGCSLNELAKMPFSTDDWTQFAQLMGYSVSGAAELDYFDRDVLAQADAATEDILRPEESHE